MSNMWKLLQDVIPDYIERARAVAAAGTEDFASLIRIAGLDPKRSLRFENWSGIDFSGSDLRGFDFTAARLNGCRFDGARIDGARFDQAEIDGANPRAAADWPGPQAKLGEAATAGSRRSSAARRGVPGCAVRAGDGGGAAGAVLDGLQGGRRGR